MKRKLEDSRHDKLYFESVLDSHVRENDELKARLHAVTMEKEDMFEQSQWVRNKGRRRFY